MLKKMMEQYAASMEIEDSFATDVPGVYMIPIDEGITIYVTEIPQGFSLKCRFEDCPKVKIDPFFTYIMGANLLGKETHGNVIGLDESGEGLVLTRDVDHEVNFQEFSFILEDFFNQVDFWKEETVAFLKD